MSQENVEIVKTVLIHLQPEEVWSYIADPRHDPHWCARVLSVQQVAGTGPGSHAGYRVTRRPARLKRPTELAVTVKEFEPPHRMRMRAQDDDGVFTVTYELQPTAVGTWFTQRRQIAWREPRFQRRIARRAVTRDVEYQLWALKRLLEAGGALSSVLPANGKASPVIEPRISSGLEPGDARLLRAGEAGEIAAHPN